MPCSKKLNEIDRSDIGTEGVKSVWIELMNSKS